jgi:transposase
VEILTRLSSGNLETAQAAALLGLSPRQTRRLRAKFIEEGMAAVVHGLQGRAPANRTDAGTVARILELTGEGGKYHDFNVCHLQELLAREEGIAIGRSTLDRLLKQQGLRAPRRRKGKEKRRRRQRVAAEGMLVQVDGSPHDWLEGRGPKLALMGAVDDAGSKLLYARFHPTEDQAGYLMMFRTIAVEHGLPMAYYHDRHTILRSPKEPTLEDELAGRTPMSQVQRLLSELGVESIPAHSPQAKGRVERLWRTLQDRLVKELRLAGVTTMDEANAFLPGFIERHNARFALAPADPEPAWVPLPPDTDLAYYFAAREARVVRPDHTLAYERAIYQLRPAAGEPSLVGKSVRVHTTPEGELFLYDGKRRLRHKLVDPVAPAPAAPKPDKPAPPAKKTNPQGEAHRRAWLFGNHHRGEAPPARRGPL